jgi:hypothetical protein
VLVLAIVLAAAPAAAHGLRTAHLELAEITPGHAVAHLQLGAPDPALALVPRGSCAIESADDAAFTRTWRVDCTGPLALAIAGLGPITSDVVVTYELADGTRAIRLVRPDAPELGIAEPDSVARQFVGMGLVHIATGYDHLLFLLLLVLLLRDVRSVLLAESAFTLSHTVSFSATALGWIHVSSAAAETCIALSLVLLAADIQIRGPGAARWRGAAMALVFGLVHGLGFAGGLREIGLPDHAIGRALVGFAAGIELGQIAFLAGVLALLHFTRHVELRPRIELAAVYAVGGFSAYLVLARGLALM